VAASTLVGAALVVLVAIAAVAVAWLVWDRAEDRARVEDERAAQTAREALQNSLGRVLTTLRGADGLVDQQGRVDPVSFRAFARAVTSIPSTGSLALEKVVAAEERAQFESSTGLPIVEFVRTGVFRPAGDRPMYLPIVSVWPQTAGNRSLLGLDLLSEPSRRRTLTLARATRQASFTELIPFAAGRQGLLAFKPLYAPGGRSASPVAYVSASFSTSVIGDVLGQLPPDLRMRVEVDGERVFQTADPPAAGKAHSLDLGGRRWVVSAQGDDASHTAAAAILLGGLGLAGLLGAFTRSRISFERRLLRATYAEREARERSELLERNAAHLAAAVTAHDVAASTVADLTATGIEIAVVHTLRGDLVEVLARAGLPDEQTHPVQPYRLDAHTAGSEAMRTGEIVDVKSPEEYDARFPDRADARRRHHVQSVIAVPLRNTEGTVIGALVAASREPRWLDRSMRLLVTGVAEQCGLALERARLQSIDEEARRHADILQRLTAGLSAAALPTEVAEAAVPCLLEGFDADLCSVGLAAGEDVRTLKVPAGTEPTEVEWRPVPLTSSTPTADAIRTRRVIELHSRDEIAERYPREVVEQLIPGIDSMLVVPLPRATGAIGVAYAEHHVLGHSDRGLLDAIAEELTQALERAALLERERDARLHAELMERNAAHLAAAMTVADVAAATVADFEAFGAGIAFVWRLTEPSTLEVLAASDVPQETRRRFGAYPIELGGLVADAMVDGALVSVGTGEEYDTRYPQLADERQRLAVESLVAVPLRAGSGEVVGAIFAASPQRSWLNEDRRQLVLGVAEQTGVALERATLFETEREARRLAELLEQNAAHLAAAVTAQDVATSTVTDLDEAGMGLAAVHMRRGDEIEILAAAGVPQDLLGASRVYAADAETLGAETLRTGRAVEVGSAAELEERYPGSTAFRRATGAESVLSVPLRATDRRVIGALVVSSPRRRWLNPSRRQVIMGIAEQCGLALERAQLQADAEQAAATSAFFALLGEALERATTVVARARRLTEALTDERATFAAVHLSTDEDPPELVAISGSRPAELVSDDAWAEHVLQAITTGRPMFVGGAPTNGVRLEDPPPLLVLPLRARGHNLGVLTIRSAAGADWRPAISPGFAREIAVRAAIALDNALLYERERDVSHSLQLGLLGGALPAFDQVVVAAAYRPGTAALEVGGDWYDAFPLPSGAVGLVVGDVVGHGLDAAVAMGQLRGAVSALAQTGGPALILRRLDGFVETVPAAATATLAYVELDAVTGRIAYACAGHPPPLVVSPDGRARYLWDGRSAPLGSMLGEERAEAVDRLEPGETLVLYTDGLVERRSESFDLGLERLSIAARVNWGDGTALADDICDALLGGQGQDDDVCVLTVHRPPAGRLFSHSFHASPAELAGLRDGFRAWLQEHAVDEEVVRSSVLAASEAASNAIEHGYGCDGKGVVTVMAQLEDDGRLEMTVRDEGKWRDGNGDDDRGRGLLIMQAIVDALAIERDDEATVLRMSRSPKQKASA
jgi:serine/threonine-protein kinase RsbW